MVYDYIERTTRNPKDRDDTVAQKTRQYNDQVKAGTMSRDQADRVLNAMRTTPLRGERRGTLTLVIAQGRIMVSGQTLNGKKAWTRIEDGLAVSQPWFGGDAWTLQTRAEPYSLASTLIPVMPFQLPAVRAFADLEIDGTQGEARILAVSTGTDQYLDGKLRFEQGRLAEAEISGLERTRYSDYTGNVVPLPKRIVLERLYDVNGEPQVTRTYTGRSITHPVIPPLKELTPIYGTVVIDQRTEPSRQFTYRPSAGSFLKQAQNGEAVPKSDQVPDAPGSSIPFSTWLLGGSLLLLAGTAVARILAGRRRHPVGQR